MTRLLALPLAIVISGPLFAEDLPVRLERVIKAHSIKKEQLSLAVVDVTRSPQQQVFAVNERKEMIPASVTKIATAAAVLQKLGPSFKVQTGLWTSAPVKGQILKGDLILKGGGDSGFVSETMWFLVNEFTRLGVTKIDGDIVVDDSDFDSVRNDPSRDPERVDRAYDAPVGAMSFNWNSLNIYVRPGDKGDPAKVFLDPIGSLFKVDNRAKTVAGAANNLIVSRDGGRVSVRGTIGERVTEVAVYKNIDEPATWAGENLVAFLGQRGITVSGKVKQGRKPGSARLVAKADSKPISQAVADMMKFSNNYVAEMLTKNLASAGGASPATMDQGMKQIRQYMVDIGIPEERFTLINPSGLSRRNRISARDLAEVLVVVQKKFPIFSEFMASLPLAGVDGTLKNRMKSTPAVSWVRAKTGNLSGVVSLAGYAGQADGSVRAFAFIFNGNGEQGEMARRLFDALAVELVQ